MLRRAWYLMIASLLVLGALLPCAVGVANAANAANWKAGFIIDDAVFTDVSSMSAADIQNFLNQKIGTTQANGTPGVCDTNGTKASEFGGGTRAQYGTAHGNSTPFTCLKDYYEVPKLVPGPNVPANNYGGQPIPAGAESAAQLIWDAAQRYSISPKVLLTILQKESAGPLITDDWPFKSQYTYAMGAHCPDTSGCDPNYAGFSIQVSESAELLRYYVDNMTQPWWTYKKPFATNNILWNVANTGCGAGDVYIQSKATAALYTYTPYQPNQAALNNLYGNGDSCSAYGNRNFWRIFTDWFGSTQTNTPYAWTFVSALMYADSNRTIPFGNAAVNITPGSKAYLEVKARNNGNQAWGQSTLHLATSHPGDRSSVFHDTSWLSSARIQMVESSVAPGDIGTFDFSITAPQILGAYDEYFSLVADGITWLNDPGLYYSINVVSPRSGSRSSTTGLAVNQSITPGQYMLSADGSTTFQLSTTGIARLASNGQTTWSSTPSGAAKLLVMQPDGNLVEYSKTGGVIWNSATSGNPNAYLKLGTDGNLVIYNAGGTPIWSTSTSNTPDYYSVAFYAFRNGSLLPGQSMNTPQGNDHLELQTDGNLVLYNGGHPLWASGTSGQNISNLSMQPDGNLVLYDASGRAVWNSHTYN